MFLWMPHRNPLRPRFSRIPDPRYPVPCWINGLPDCYAAPCRKRAGAINIWCCAGAASAPRAATVAEPSMYRCRNGPAARSWAVGRLSLRVMVCKRGPNGSAPGIIEGQPWSILLGSTYR